MEDADWIDVLDEMDVDDAAKRIALAHPIPQITLADRISLGWERPENLTLVDLYLEGDAQQHAAGVATLLEWFNEARALGHQSGAWLGRLIEAREFLLGVIERGWGFSAQATRERLVSMRAGGPRGAAPRPPLLPMPPRHRLDLPSEFGRYHLGRFAVGNVVTILEGGFPGGRQRPIDDLTIEIGTRAGNWDAYLVHEDGPSSLSAQTFGEKVDEGFLWLLLAHESVGPRVGAPDGLIPEVGEWGGKLSVIFGEPTPRQIQSIRYAVDEYAAVWEWGAAWNRPRCGVPAALGGVEGAREWIGLVDTVSA